LGHFRRYVGLRLHLTDWRGLGSRRLRFGLRDWLRFGSLINRLEIVGLRHGLKVRLLRLELFLQGHRLGRDIVDWFQVALSLS
jgi:hypothetical protein